jgi:hypothetical protein
MTYELVDLMDLIDPADMVDPMDLRRERMSAALQRPSEVKVFCQANVRSPRTGYVTVSCSMHLGHVDQGGQPNAHVDVHTGARWSA